MKTLLASLMLILVGCQSAPVAAPLPLPPRSAPEPRPIAAVALPPVQPPPSAAAETRFRQQAQLIEALVSQNDALTAKLAAITPPAETPPAPSRGTPPAPQLTSAVSVPVQITPPLPSPAVTAPPPAPPRITAPVLMPNSDGVIDLVVAALPTDEPANPFVVRAVPAESVREITLHVSGTVTGPVPCAVINERLVQTGEAIESFAVERITADAVFLRRGEHQLRLPVAAKPARVRLPL